MSRPDETGPVSEARIASLILGYLDSHPDAKDTAEGIAQWWVEEDPLKVRCVLEKLVELGRLAKSSASMEFYFRAGRDLVHMEACLGAARNEPDDSAR